MLRDAAAFKLFKELFPDSGLYSSDAKLVEVFINDVYWGVYVLVEQQEAKNASKTDTTPTRINVQEVPKNEAGTNIGYIIEFDAYSSSEPEDEQFTIDYTCGEEDYKVLDYYGTEVTNINEGYTLKSDINSHEQKLFIQQYMNELWAICYKAANGHGYYKIKDTYTLGDDTFTEEYTDVQGSNDAEKCVDTVSKLIDIDSLVDSYIFNELVCDPDLHWSSFYMSIDFSEGADKKLRFEAPWDFDSTMGNRPFNGPKIYSVNGGASEMYAGKAQPDIWQNDENAANGNPWLMLFIRSDWFKQLVKEKWAAIQLTQALQNTLNYIDAYGDYTTRLEFNRTRWGNPGDNNRTSQELNEFSRQKAKISQNASAEYLKQWINDRWYYVNEIITNANY